MKRNITIAALILGVVVLTTGSSMQAEPGSAFDKLKALAGEWEGQRADGITVKVTYQVLGGGATLVERTEAGDEPAMLSVYHRDNDDLRMTHYCSDDNQPRMKAASVMPDAREISFEFVDATNLKEADDGYINSLTVSFEDSDNITQKWGWTQNGQQEYTVVSLKRVK
jgi:hypothetical protein